MKNKLKAKHFRYLRKEHIKDVPKLIKNLRYVSGDFANLQNGIHHFFYFATSFREISAEDLIKAYTLIEIKELLEVAQVLLVKYDLKQYTGAYYLFDDDGFFHKDVNPSLFVKELFDFKSLKQWDALLDMMTDSIMSRVPMNETIYQKDIVQARYFLHQLPYVMYKLKEAEISEYELPEFC